MANEMKITLTLPLPPKELSPNARLHHFPKAAAVKLYRSDSMWSALAQLRREGFTGWNRFDPRPARMTETYRIAGKRKHDVRNLFAAFKAGEDGLVDAGILPGDDDSVLEHGPPRIERVATKAEECVVVEIEEIAV